MIRATDPEKRCQHVGQSGQCQYEVVEGARNCLHHGGLPTAKRNNALAVSSYRLEQYQARMEHHAVDAAVKSLRGEIGILRMMIETRINQCKDDYDLMLQSASIAKLITDCNTLVTNCHRIETLTGQMLDKQSIIEFAQNVIAIISEKCEPEQAEAIAEELLCLIQPN